MMTVLLLVGGMTSKAWAAQITYHILTLPCKHTATVPDASGWVGNTRVELDGYRQEALRVVVTGNTVQLPAYLKSPLAKNFTFYQSSFVQKSTKAEKVYEGNGNTFAYLYSAPIAPYTKVTKSGGEVTEEIASTVEAWTAHTDGTQKTTTSWADYNSQKSALADGIYYFKMDCLVEYESPITVNSDIYVTYEYDPDNTIVKLDGSEKYNIKIGDYGFLTMNRGRNNRPAIIPAAKIADHPEFLTSDEFVTIPHTNKQEIEGTNSVQGYWKDDPYNTRDSVAYQFHFLFRYYGIDPYNITISSAYNADRYYVEKYGSGAIVKKWYKGATLFAQTTAAAFISSDDNKQYTQTRYSDPETEVTYEGKYGYYKGLGTVWNSFALLYASDKDGNIDEDNLVVMGTRTVKGNGDFDYSSGKHFYLSREKDNNNNNLVYKSLEKQYAPVVDKNMYEQKTVNFIIKTPFGNTTTASIVLSEYTLLGIKDIDLEDIPAELKRKYCSFNNTFYKDAAMTERIYSYSALTEEPYNVYVGYTVNTPFKTVDPRVGATDTTWYEMTDEGSTEENGKKIKYDGTANFKNNGAYGTYDKTSEFALVGDPYEMRVVYRDATETAGADRYVGGSTNLGVNTTAGDGYCWEIPFDNADGFVLRKYNGTGHWYWVTDHLSESFSYATKAHDYSVANGNKQTLTFTITNLTYLNGHYITVTKDGAGDAQVLSTVPALTDGKGAVQSDGTATVTVNIDANTTGSDKVFTLSIQEYNGSSHDAIGDPTVITVTQAGTAYAGNYITYSTTNSTRIKLLELPKRTYTYKIVDKAGHIAVKATASQAIYSSLSLSSIPSIIVSPFLVGETLTFYSTFTEGSRKNLSGKITQTPGANATIYVKYTTTALDDKPIKLSEDQEFNVRLNGKYLYYNTSTSTICSADEVTSTEELKKYYLWKLRGRDPYAMLIDNVGARASTDPETPDIYDDDGNKTTPTRQPGAWVKLASSPGNAVGLLIDTDRSHAQNFIAKSSLNRGIYEVMVATGDAVDASTTYYNIGRPADNTVKIYDNNTASGGYAHGNSALAFNLDQTIVYTYYLIDKAKHKLLEIETKNADLVLPAEYQSPLVSTYYYYALDSMDIDGDEYTPKNPASTIDNLEAVYTKTSGDYASQWSAADSDHQKTADNVEKVDEQAKQLKSKGNFYFKIGETSTYYHVNVTEVFHDKICVTYDKNDLVTFNDDGSPYMLRFLNPYAGGYYLEDGNDKLTASRIQAIYPYCNGDGSLNIYGSAMNEEQMAGGASTRPRWIWFFDSDHNDPYHVKIHSRSTISYGGITHPTYLETKAVHFEQDASEDTKHIVTCGSLPGIASTNPTEYMVLGTAGQYRLLTTYPIDETVVDGSSDKDKRQYVTSFEQYWKTYNMIKQCVLGLDKSVDKFSNDEATWVVPYVDDPSTLADESSYRATVEAKDWHSYEAIVNAVRWNGYNDKGKTNTKLVEKLEHWFQTFDMGDGAFDIESADIPPVLVLLDRHGWEIMRKPLGYNSSAALDVLRTYDSPLVEEYKFYSQATKASGCHKYSLRTNDSGYRDEIKVNGKPYTSTSLADLPPETATGVKSNGVFNDQFVTYTVKDEYEKSYKYEITFNADSTYTETGTPSKFLLLQHNRFARDNNDGGKPNYLSKPIYQGSGVAGDNGEVSDMVMEPTDTYADTNNDGKIDDNNIWYVGPNLRIDEEMGIPWTRAAEATTEKEAKYKIKKQYADKVGFDPYNIQIKHVSDNKYLTTHIATTTIVEGARVGGYDGGNTTVTLAVEYTAYDPTVDRGSEGYDHTNLQMSNQTFMAVSDANGNMQLMPRFDHLKRVNASKEAPYLTTLEDPVDHTKKASVNNWRSMGPQTTFFVSPLRIHYHIIDNNGREALRYKRGADFKPEITEHFQSPFATDFTYYTGLAQSQAPVDTTAWGNATTPSEFKRTLTRASMLADAVKLLPDSGMYYYRIGTRGTYAYKKVLVTKGLAKQQITGSLAEADVDTVDSHVYVRYDYDLSADLEADRMLQGQWYTVELANKDLQADGTVTVPDGDTQGTGVKLYSGTKPDPVDKNEKAWQWKFFVAPADPTSDYYVKPDPYAVHLFNRYSNYTTNPSLEPSPMSVAIKVPNANDGADRFVVLSHPSGGYALAVAKEYSDYNYYFLNGESMTTSVAANTAIEAGFNYKSGTISEYAKLEVHNDVEHEYTYYVINQDSIIALRAVQSAEETATHGYEPYLPEDAQSPLLNIDKDYKYYGFVSRPKGKYAVIPQTILSTLSGLYDDYVYVRYDTFNINTTEYLVPNKKDLSAGKVIKHAESKDAALHIDGGLPYDIIWENDNMMRSNDDSNTDANGDYIKGKSGQNLQADGTNGYIWKFQGNDPYALKIYNNKQGKYIHAASADNDAACTLTTEPTKFMLLNKEGYDYGVLAMTEHQGSMLTMTDDGNASTLDVAKITTGDPSYFIIFGLSTHKLIYHLTIANIGDTVTIPYSASNVPQDPRAKAGLLYIAGTTQRDLNNDNYQLGSTILGQPYSYDAGEVSIGDLLKVPSVFDRQNCVYFFYVDNIQSSGDGSYQKTADDNTAYESAKASLSSTGYYYFRIGTSTYTYKRVHVTATSPSLVYTEADCTADDWNNIWQDNDDLNALYKGLEVTRLMSDPNLIGGLVKINIGYAFQTGLETNAGEGFVTSVNQNLWYTYEAKHDDGTPYLAHYTNAWGLQCLAGRDTRYTNDYLWTPLGDVYGFTMYNRYMIKNSNGAANVMTSASIADGQNLKMAIPGSDGIPAGNEVYELLNSNTPGYFRVHPVANYTGTQYYVRKDPSDNYAKLSTTYTEWTFNLNPELLMPYIERINYVGGLKQSVYTANKTVLDKVVDGTAGYADMLAVQGIVYNDANIVSYEPGYYRLHNQPGVSSISPVRYASGYLHDIEKTAVSGGIPMHFYSKEGVTTTFSGLGGGYTSTNATRGDIPVIPTEYDPSTIFYFAGTGTLEGNYRSTMQTQGLYVAANANGDGANGTTTSKKQRAVMSENIEDTITFSIMDIGGAVLLIHDGATPAVRRYLNYDQSKADSIYDLRYYHEPPTDDAKWCMQPVQKEGEANTNEMPLLLATNNGGSGYYYATFYAPFDVLLPDDKPGVGGDADTTYNAYICKKWYYEGVNPSPVPASGSYEEGKFVPAGTPVIIRTTDNSNYITLALPTSGPTTPALTGILSGQYLEQKLTGSNDVYALGLPFTSVVTLNPTTGDITAELEEKATSGVGFYVNANKDKEHEASQSLWLRNNRYVLHNKVYYRTETSPSYAPKYTPDVQFVPVNFDEEQPDEEQPDNRQTVAGDGCVYDLLGRKVATKEEVQSGTWIHRLAPGIYIADGKKIYIH